MATPEGFEPPTTRLEGCSEMSGINEVSQNHCPAEGAESLGFCASVKLIAHRIRPDSYKDLCPVCHGSGSLMTYKATRGLEFWPCPGCGEAGVSVQYGPAAYLPKRMALRDEPLRACT